MDKLIDLDHFIPILRSLYRSFFSLLFSTVFVVFIACMRASVCMIVCQLLTNKDSYITINAKTY